MHRTAPHRTSSTDLRLIRLTESSSLSWKVMFIVFWSACLFVVWKFLLKSGAKLVNQPRLLPHVAAH